MKKESSLSPAKSKQPTNDYIRKLSPVDTIKDKKFIKLTEEVSKTLRKKLVKLQEEKSKSISVQKTFLERVDLKLESDELLSETRISKLVSLGESGLHLEQITLEVEKRYENMIVGFSSFIDSLKVYINSILNDQKKEIFISILAEKSQNNTNFQTLLNKLGEVAISTPTENSRKNTHTLEAFDMFFKFCDNFKEDFYGMISSKLVNCDFRKTQLEVSKYFSQMLSQSLLGPKQFPTELFRYFESVQEKSKNFSGVATNCGSYLNMTSKYPNSVQLLPLQREIDLNLEDPEGMLATGRERNFTLLHWIDSKTLICASKKRFKIVLLSSTLSPSPKENDSNKELDDFEVDLEGFETETIYNSTGLPENFVIQSLACAKCDGRTFILVGGNNSVSCL